jgi:hypothetical protein
MSLITMGYAPHHAMSETFEPPNGWVRKPATHLDRKYTSATPVVFEHDRFGRTIQVVPTLVGVPGSETEWHVREIGSGTTLVLDGANSRSAAIAVAMEAMRGH